MGDGAVTGLAIAVGILVGLGIVGYGMKSLENFHPWRQVKGIAGLIWAGFLTVVVVALIAGAVTLVGKVFQYW